MKYKTIGSHLKSYPLLRALVAAVLLVASVVSTPLAVAAAQGSSQEVGPLSSQSDSDDTTYVSELTDEEITWTDDWELLGDGGTVTDTIETFSLESADGTYFVSYVEGEADLEDGLEAYLGGFTEALGTAENVDADEAGETFYSLDLVEDDSASQLGVFSVIVQLDGFLRVETIVAEPDALEDLFDSAKSSLEIDGDEVYPDIEAVTDTDVEVAVADDDATSTPDDEDVTPDDEDVTPDDEDVTPDDEDVTPEDEELNEDWLEAGLISATEYESPQFEYTVEWNEPWILDVYYDDADQPGTVATESGDSSSDLLYIWIEDLDAILSIQGLENTSDLTVDDYTSYWESEDYLDGFSSTAESLSVEGDDEVGASLYYLDSDFIGYNQVTLSADGESLLFLFFLAPADNFEEAFELAQDDIEVDSAGSFDVYSNADLDDVIAEFIP